MRRQGAGSPEESETGGWPAWLEALCVPRVQPSFGWLERVVLGLYSLVLAITIPFHEPWSDEAQAWLIARSSSVGEILSRRLHYEGSPGLWHVILRCLIVLHMPYGGMCWVSGAFAFAGIYVLLRYSPFPPVVRALLPFTFWMQFQYAVVARQYALTPLFVFCLCALWNRRRPWAFAVCAGLLANLSLYSLVWAGALALLWLPGYWSAADRRSRVRLAGPAGLLLAMMLLAVYTALPAPDLASLSSVPANRVTAKAPSLLERLAPPTPVPAGWASPEQMAVAPVSAASREQRSVPVAGNAFQREVIRLTHRSNGSYKEQTYAHRWSTVLHAVSAVLFSLSSFNVQALSFLIAVVVWLWSRRGLRFLLPLVLIVALGSQTSMYEHHAGLAFVALVSACWLGFSTARPQDARRSVTLVLCVLLVAVLVGQVVWSAKAVRRDIDEPYDPGRATALLLNGKSGGMRVDAYGYGVVSTMPYLAPGYFASLPFDYWIWSSNVPVAARLPVDLLGRPGIVVTEQIITGGQRLDNQLAPEITAGTVLEPNPEATLRAAGYGIAARLCGSVVMRGGVSETHCNLVWKRGAAGGGAGAG